MTKFKATPGQYSVITSEKIKEREDLVVKTINKYIKNNPKNRVFIMDTFLSDNSINAVYKKLEKHRISKQVLIFGSRGKTQHEHAMMILNKGHRYHYNECLIVINSIRDLVTNSNNAEQVQIVETLIKDVISFNKDAHILCVMYENLDGENRGGLLGVKLNEKAESVLRV